MNIPVVSVLTVHGATGADVGAADASVRGGSVAQDHRLHAARLLAEPTQPIRSARHCRWVYLDFHAFYFKGILEISVCCIFFGEIGGETI